jgi:hypothetical protein
MIQRATGSLDVISLAQRSGGDARPGAVSMMLSGIVKRHKRTLMNFVDRFYVPALRKILWRNMQYYPERYTPRNWQFLVSGTMGILQREYESSNLVQLLNTMEPQSPEYKMILMGVISNTGLVHRRELIEMLKKSISMAQQAQQMQGSRCRRSIRSCRGCSSSSGKCRCNCRSRDAGEDRRTHVARSPAGREAQNEALEPQFKSLDVATKGIYQCRPISRIASSIAASR